MPAVETAGALGSFRRTYAAYAAAQGKGYALVQAADEADNVAAIVSVANASNVIGFQDDDSINAGDPIAVVRDEEVTAIAGAANIAAGSYLKTDNQGRLIPATAAGDNVCAQAISSSVAIGDYLLVQVVKFTLSVGMVDNVTYYTAAGAIPVAPGTSVIDGAAALAMTLAAPTAGLPSAGGQDGTILFITAETTHAHTITAPANAINGNKHIITFADQGDGVELEAINGIYNVRSLVGAAALS